MIHAFVYYEEFVYITGSWRLHRCGEVPRRILWEIASYGQDRGTIVMVDA